MARSKFLCMAVLALSSSPVALFAQGTGGGTGKPAQDSEHLGQILLDADAPAVTAGTGPTAHLDAEDIERAQVTTLQDVVRDVPSVVTGHRGSLLNNTITIRGFGGNYHYSGDPATKTIVDGISDTPERRYQSTTGAISDPALLRSVDVTTGPLASLEYGSGITGGAVSARTINGSDLTEGQDGFRFRQMLGYNSNGKGWLTSSTLAWQANSTVDFLFNYTRRGQDVQKNGLGEAGSKGFNVPSLLFKSRLRLDDANSLTLSYSRYESSEDFVQYSSMLHDYGGLGFADIDRKGSVTSLTWNYNPADNDLIDLELSLSRSDREENIVARSIAVPPARPFQVEAEAGLYKLTTDRITLTNTARFATGNIGHSLRAGLSWTDAERLRIDPARPGAGKERTIAFFAIDTMDFGNDWRATVGLRLEDQKISNSQRIIPTATPPAVPPPAYTADYGPFDNFARTLGGGLEKGFGNGITAFGSFTYTEALPTYGVLSTFNGNLQKSRNWEGGVRYEGSDVFAAGDRLTGSITAYRTEVWNTLYSLTASGKELRRQGVEIGANYQMASGTYLSGKINFTDHEQLLASGVWAIDSYSTSDTLAVTVGHKFASGLDLSWRMEAQKSILIGASQHAGFGVHDFKASYTVQQGQLEGLTIDFGVENVFDKAYHYSQTPLMGSTSATPGKPWVLEQGRNIRLNLSKTF